MWGLTGRALGAAARAACGGSPRYRDQPAPPARLRALPYDGFDYHLDQGKTLPDGPCADASPDKPLGQRLRRCRTGGRWSPSPRVRCFGGCGVWGGRVGSALSDRAVALISQGCAALARVGVELWWPLSS